MASPGQILRLGTVGYRDAWALQRELVTARMAGQIPDTLILLEHPHIYTLGRSGHLENVLIDEAEAARLGAEVVWIDRGGDVTYHGPGQLVGYPIFALDRLGKDVHQHVRRIEEVLIRTLAEFGVRATRDPEHVGVWVGQDKIAAIGVRVSRWVTSHGFALNVDPDLAYFSKIVPCGIADRGVTSLARLLGRTVGRLDVEPILVRQVANVFESELEQTDLARRFEEITCGGLAGI